MTVTRDTFAPLQRAFAMFALASIANKPRDKLLAYCHDGVTIEPVTERETTLKLQECVAVGDITCIVPDPQPFVWLVYRGSFGAVRMLYGLWVGREASWKGKRALPVHAIKPLSEENANGNA